MEPNGKRRVMSEKTERIGNSPYLTTGEAADYLRLKRNTLEKTEAARARPQIPQAWPPGPLPD